jgi:osmoprotectant transport system ATP-binding protein
MGDRIAIIREGGVLVQYDTPDAILAAPADEFVARFVGEDRALRRLALRRVGELELEPAPNPSGDSWPLVSSCATVRNALSLMLEAGADRVLVVGDDGARLGVLPLDRATAPLRS